MSKIGKKYTISSEQGISNIFDLLKSFLAKYAYVSDFTEVYNNNANLYEGNITIELKNSGEPEGREILNSLRGKAPSSAPGGMAGVEIREAITAVRNRDISETSTRLAEQVRAARAAETATNTSVSEMAAGIAVNVRVAETARNRDISETSTRLAAAVVAQTTTSTATNPTATRTAESIGLIEDKRLDIKFVVDTHYEELMEIKNFQVSTGISGSTVNLADSLEVYKYRSPLEYNFLVKNYEDFLSARPNINETALPYFYGVLRNFLGGFQVASYFENPRQSITRNSRNDLITNVIPSEVVIDNKPLRIDKYLERFNFYKEQFPFYTDISFDTHPLGVKSITSAIQEKSLLPQLLESIVNETTSSMLFASSSATGINKINVSEFDVGSFLHKSLNNFVEGDFSFIFDINQRIDDKARTFKEILEGKEEYTEVLGYHLRKYEGNTNTLIQEWYLPNVSETEMKWVDSQIKYGKRYTYKLDLIVLTFATECQITDLTIQNNKINIKFINKPLVKVFVLKNLEGSYATLGATYTNSLLDYPPLEPEVELVPYIGVATQIKLNFNTSIGLKTVPAINFSPNEEIARDRLRLAQNKDVNSPLLTFQADEPSAFIEIYRLETKPKSYNDFFGNILKTLSTNNSSGASFVDNIQANKKYYYTGRAIDFHGNISNPTPVYELEIINDNGLIVPYINLVEFDKQENNKQLSKSFKRYLKIQPATVHRLANFEKTNESNIQLGGDTAQPWNKKFKLRLTSKSTGKKIDVNFTFKYKKP